LVWSIAFSLAAKHEKALMDFREYKSPISSAHVKSTHASGYILAVAFNTVPSSKLTMNRPFHCSFQASANRLTLKISYRNIGVVQAVLHEIQGTPMKQFQSQSFGKSFPTVFLLLMLFFSTEKYKVAMLYYSPRSTNSSMNRLVLWASFSQEEFQDSYI
jgi:hypothetical protein